jgi:hypothetical protein
MRMTLSLIPIAALIALNIYSQSMSQAEFKKRIAGPAAIEFYVAGRHGPAPKYRVRWFANTKEGSPNLAKLFKGLAAQNLKPGEYEYVLEPETPPPGYPQGLFHISGREQLWDSFPHWVTLDMPDGVIADMIIGGVTGRVKPAPAKSGEPVWVRLQEVVEHNKLFQAKVGDDGTFEYPASFDGTVTVTACRGRDVLSLSLVHFTNGRPDHPLEIPLRNESTH